MKAKIDAHLKIWQKYLKEELDDRNIQKALKKALSLPWIKRSQVFTDQFVFVVDLHGQKFIYVSPTTKKVLGYEPEQFTGIDFLLTLMTPQEWDISERVSKIFIDKLASLRLNPEKMLMLRSTHNIWLKKADGTEVNTLQHTYALTLNDKGIPNVSLMVCTDITGFNNDKSDRFYSLSLTKKNGPDEVLLSGRIKSSDVHLTKREAEIFSYICRGMSSGTIARKLNISIETVKSHRKRLLDKTKSKNSIDLVRYGYAHGWK